MSRSRNIALVSLALVALAPSAAWGADLDVSPVRLHISAARRSATLTLVNRGAEPLRYQITAEAWRQTPSGEMILTPTQDLVFFPSLVEIAPGATRRIRIATVRGISSSAETTYRLTLVPLPDGVAPAPGTVRVLTRFSLPVFVQPRALEPRPAAALRVSHGRLRVSVSNPGNSYFVSESVRVVGRSSSGAVLVDRALPGWYVLAHGERVYEVPLDADVCAALAGLEVAVTTEGASARAALARDAIQCSP